MLGQPNCVFIKIQFMNESEDTKPVIILIFVIILPMYLLLAYYSNLIWYKYKRRNYFAS